MENKRPVLNSDFFSTVSEARNPVYCNLRIYWCIMYYSIYWCAHTNWIYICVIQGILVPKLTLGPFLTLSVRNGPNVSFGINVPYNTVQTQRPKKRRSPKLKTGYRCIKQFWNPGFTNGVRQFCRYQYFSYEILFYLVSSYSRFF